MLTTLAVVAGLIVTGVAVAMASAAVLAVAALLLLAGVAGAALIARSRLIRTGPKVAVVGGTAALAVAVLVPASMNVDPCERLGQDADLSGCNLSDRDLASEDLRGADLGGADLSGTDLGRATLTGANLDGADLRGADLSGARLAQATVTGADLRGAALDDAVMVNTDLTGARVEDATFTGATLAQATLTGVDLGGVDLSGATLDDADLSQADLGDAHLSDADLGAADVSEANLTDADLARTNLRATNLQGARLEGANLAGASLPDADLRNADLSRADLSGASAPGANFRDAVFTEAHLESNDFVGAEGIADADLAAAFGVPARSLAGATARRGVVLDRFEDIVHAVAPARSGRPVREVHSYRPSREFHPAIILDATGETTPSWASGFQSQWAPTATRYAELVVVTQPETRESVEVCQYTFLGAPASPVTRYIVSTTVRVLSAHDGRLVGQRTFRGGNPRACGATEPISVTEIEGSAPDLAGQARPWLARLVNPPADRT